MVAGQACTRTCNWLNPFDDDHGADCRDDDR